MQGEWINMKYIYIAGPYSKGDPVVNTRKAIQVGNYLAEHGYVPFIPHLTLFWHFLIPQDIEFWYEYDLAWMAKCDCLLRLPGESTGADNEVFRMKVWGMPVYYSVEEAIEAIQK